MLACAALSLQITRLLQGQPLPPALIDEEETFSTDMQLASWNLAAVNNNPFEYWVTHKDPAYNKLMEDVQAFIEEPGAKDVAVSEGFTDAMFAELVGIMECMGWEGVSEVKLLRSVDYKKRKIISEFIKDSTIGSKRLASMPDRMTNTINTTDGKQVCRPTVCFQINV